MLIDGFLWDDMSQWEGSTNGTSSDIEDYDNVQTKIQHYNRREL